MFKRYKSIGPYREWVKNVRHNLQYVGQDDNNQPSFNYNIKLPSVKIEGTVKLHGTNAGIVYKDGEIYAQKKLALLSLQKDNYGFCDYVMQNKAAIIAWIKSNTDKNHVVIHGEWCGKSISKKVAISQLSARFVFFKVSEGDINDWTAAPDINIFNIRHYKMYELEVDMNYPELSIPAIDKLTTDVDALCPVAEAFGVSGIGEGIVWWSKGNNMFKTKGDNHTGGGGQGNRVRATRVAISPEKLESIQAFVNYVLTESRLEQGLEFVDEIAIKCMGKYIRWILSDIVKEETDTLIESNLTFLAVNKYIATGARIYFTQECDRAVFGDIT